MLDASALLAYLQGEKGAPSVAEAVAGGALISSVNLAEVLTKRVDAGDDPQTLVDRLRQVGLLEGAVEVVSVGLKEAVAIADLRTATRSAGLSLGDRACLALGRLTGLPVVTADANWSSLTLPLTIQTIC